MVHVSKSVRAGLARRFLFALTIPVLLLSGTAGRARAGHSSPTTRREFLADSLVVGSNAVRRRDRKQAAGHGVGAVEPGLISPRACSAGERFDRERSRAHRVRALLPRRPTPLPRCACGGLRPERRIAARDRRARGAGRSAASPDVEWAEPRRVFRLQFVPNDPQFAQQWGLNNPGGGGTVLARRRGTSTRREAWDVSQGSASTVIAIIDTGIDLDHPDLDAKIWQEKPGRGAGDVDHDGRPGVAGFDDDGDGPDREDSANRQPGNPGWQQRPRQRRRQNGYADDFRGWNFLTNVNNPQDDQGTDALRGHRGGGDQQRIGVAGARPNCRVMALQAFNRPESATTSRSRARSITRPATARR